MAVPVVDIQPDKIEPYAPGETITLSWVVTDADNATATIVWSGTDSQGNTVEGELVINRQGSFTMNAVAWANGGQPFLIDNTACTATSVVPEAA